MKRPNGARVSKKMVQKLLEDERCRLDDNVPPSLKGNLYVLPDGGALFVVDWVVLEGERRRTVARDEGVARNLRLQLGLMVQLTYDAFGKEFNAVDPRLALATDVSTLIASEWRAISDALGKQLAAVSATDLAPIVEAEMKQVQRVLWLADFGTETLPADTLAAVLEGWQSLEHANDSRATLSSGSAGLMGSELSAAVGWLAQARATLAAR